MEYFEYFFTCQLWNNSKTQLILTLYRLIQVGASYDFANDYEFFSYLSINTKTCDLIYTQDSLRTFKFSKIHWLPKDKQRLSLVSGETDLSGQVIQMIIYIFILVGGESWGAGEDIQLALSHNSPSYDYFKFLYDHNKVRFIYFHGFLETINQNNRYIAGKGFEISNYKNLVASISEVIIYSGFNRPVDFSFLNPISSILEVEQNNRQNLLGFDNANAIWQISIDKLIKNRLRISGNLMIDELILDSEEIDSGKVNNYGWSFRASYNIVKNNNLFNLYFNTLYISSHALKHGIGYNNFVQRGHPLGWRYGSDGTKFKIGLRSL